MDRFDLQKLARIRIKDARVLLQGGCYEGAYYLAGYAVECALKACIAKRTRRYDFPDKNLVSQSYTHNLQGLIKAAGLETDLMKEIRLNKDFERAWGIVKDWSEDVRYQSPVAKQTAKDLYAAITGRKRGVLPWLRKRW